MDEKERFIKLFRKAISMTIQERMLKEICKKVDKYRKHKIKLLAEKKLINNMFDEYEKQFGEKLGRLE